MRIRVYEDYDSTNAQSPLSVFEIGDFNTYKPSVFNSNNNTCDYDCDDYCEDEYCDIVDDIVDDIIDDFTDYSDIDNDEYIDVNDVTNDVKDENDFYEDLEALGFVFILASNDIHTIHVNACGENFKELHESCDELYKLLNDYADKCLEMCCEDGHFIHNINSAKELIDGWENRDISNKGYNICKGTQIVIDVLHDVTISIQELYPYVTSDIQSTMDEWTRELNSKMKYFLNRVTECDCEVNESKMLRNTRHDNNTTYNENLSQLELGQSYVDFDQVEDHIEDYNCNPIDFQENDYIIRDFQFGHLPNGGNKGYIPYRVSAIVYDDISDSNGYKDHRTRLELDDGKETFYIVCQNDRFNGMFHRLKKDSVKVKD